MTNGSRAIFEMKLQQVRDVTTTEDRLALSAISTSSEDANDGHRTCAHCHNRRDQAIQTSGAPQQPLICKMKREWAVLDSNQ